MFGISWTEFLVILFVAVCLIPAKYWPDVARFFARVIKYIRQFIWKITDVSQQIQERIELEKPINDLIENATNEIFIEKKTKSEKAHTQ